MRSVYEKIQELEAIPSYSKHQQLVNGIINAIDEKILEKGDTVPSVNNFIKELGFARETIVKAYKDLIGRGIIESKNRLGYFVSNTDTGQTAKVALLMYAIDTFQEQFYNSFRNELGENVHLDVFFHHGNIDVFETILFHVNGKYGMYVVSPIPHPKTKELLDIIPRNKFLMTDRYEQLDGDFSYITQEFEESSYNAFAQLAKRIAEFDEIIFFCEHGSLVPVEIVRAFKKFLKVYKIKGKIIDRYEPGSIKKSTVYFTLDNAQLYEMLRDSKEKKLKLGEDIGILSHNDEPVKEIIFDGITTYSTDFALMGKRAARFVLDKKPAQEIIPTKLIRRNSL
jgi:DNA-binding transcriptional regulator YhcF (GntR family)